MYEGRGWHAQSHSKFVNIFTSRDYEDTSRVIVNLHFEPSCLDLSAERFGGSCLVQFLIQVGGSDDHHPLVGLEAIHLHQQLVEGLRGAGVESAAPRLRAEPGISLALGNIHAHLSQHFHCWQ